MHVYSFWHFFEGGGPCEFLMYLELVNPIIFFSL